MANPYYIPEDEEDSCDDYSADSDANSVMRLDGDYDVEQAERILSEHDLHRRNY